MADLNQNEPYIEDGEIYEPPRHSVLASIGYALIYVGMVIGVSVILACVGWMAANDVLALNKIEHSATITIGASESIDEVASKLKENGLIDYEFLFKLFADITKGEAKISQGTFTLDTDMDYSALISNLSSNSGTRAEIQVTIPEGYTIDQIFALLEEKGVAYVDELKEHSANYDYAFDFLQGVVPLGDYRRLEGYLFPATYIF
ncbi:MAG: endolytic transglycosylase MltG, partial [Eubacteriales bacterium]